MGLMDFLGADYRSGLGLPVVNIPGCSPIGDNFNEENAHVIPMLMRRIHEARIAKRDEVTIWGTGSPKREFLHVDDLADACVQVMRWDSYEVDPMTSHLNVGTGEDLSIKELAELLCKVVGFEGTLNFDHSKPDGMPRKLLDVSRINALGWKAKTPLEEGLISTYQWFLENEGSFRRL